MIIAEDELKTHSVPNDEINENFTNVSIADTEVNTIDTQQLNSNDLHDADYNGNNLGLGSADNIHNANGNDQSNPAEEFANEGKESRKREIPIDDSTPFDESTTFDENINETDDVNAGDFSAEKRVKRGLFSNIDYMNRDFNTACISMN